jgi:predicted dienelactone hydrolase
MKISNNGTACSSTDELKAKLICTDPAGVDRAATHRDVGKAVVSFFNKTVGPSATVASN